MKRRPFADSPRCAVQIAAADGTFQYYVGESDNFVKRFETHRRKFKEGLRAAAFVRLVHGNEKSSAKRIESDLIKKLAGQVSHLDALVLNCYFLDVTLRRTSMRLVQLM